MVLTLTDYSPGRNSETREALEIRTHQHPIDLFRLNYSHCCADGFADCRRGFQLLLYVLDDFWFSAMDQLHKFGHFSLLISTILPSLCSI
jgi:hypothetical protein